MSSNCCMLIGDNILYAVLISNVGCNTKREEGVVDEAGVK